MLDELGELDLQASNSIPLLALNQGFCSVSGTLTQTVFFKFSSDLSFALYGLFILVS